MYLYKENREGPLTNEQYTLQNILLGSSNKNHNDLSSHINEPGLPKRLEKIMFKVI